MVMSHTNVFQLFGIVIKLPIQMLCIKVKYLLDYVQYQRTNRESY